MTAPPPPRQPSLWDAPPLPDAATLEGRFSAFHAAHPEVYACLRRLALDKATQGHRFYSIKGLYEVARVLLDVPSAHGGPRLNNDFTPLYARLLMEQEPRLAGFFRTRERRSR